MTGTTGSLRYMAPEVALARPYTEKVDVYSFALVVYAMAKNHQPFRGYDQKKHRTRVIERGERPHLESTWPKDFTALLQVTIPLPLQPSPCNPLPTLPPSLLTLTLSTHP